MKYIRTTIHWNREGFKLAVAESGGWNSWEYYRLVYIGFILIAIEYEVWGG